MANSYSFRDLDRIARFLKPLLLAVAFLSLAAAVSDLAHLRMLERGFTQDEAEFDDLRVGLLALAQLVAILATYVAFSLWIYRAHANLRARRAVRLRFTPAMAVGYLFVPILTLWKPYQAMKDLWRASQDPIGWPAIARSNWLPVWWLAWLFSNSIGQYVFRESLSAESLRELRSLALVEIASDLVDVASAVCAYFVVARISAFQARLRDTEDASSGGDAVAVATA